MYAAQEEIDSIVEEQWVEWRAQHCDGGWKVLSERIENDDDE